MITEEEVEQIFNDTPSKWEGDNAFKGLKIISKYTDNLIHAAEHDIIYSQDIHTLIENGITKEDITELAKLNWMLEDEVLACYV